jgi:hypothetical protein
MKEEKKLTAENAKDGKNVGAGFKPASLRVFRDFGVRGCLVASGLAEVVANSDSPP